MRARILALLMLGLAVDPAARAQTTLEGRIVDTATRAPLPFAHVQIDGTAFGTAANDAGRFVLRVPGLPVRLRLSRMGYAVRIADIATPDDARELGLEPAVLVLDEVIVDARYAERLVERAFDRCLDRRPTRLRGRAFYRQLTRSDTLHTEWIETFYDTAISCAGIEQWSVEHGRYALRADVLRYDYAHHRDFFAFTRRLSLVQKVRDRVVDALLPIRNRPGKRFTFTLEGRTVVDGRTVARVRYEPRSERRAAFTGVLFIDEETADVFRMEGRVAHRRFRPLHWEGRRTHYLVNQEMSFVMDFRPIDGLMAPRLIQIEYSYDQVAGRRYERDVAVSSTLLFYDIDTGDGPGLRYRRTDTVSDYEAIDREPYDPNFWTAHPVLAENPVETSVRRAFEATDSFGALFGGAPKPRD